MENQENKSHTSILERLRKRSGLLVAIVGLALMAFVLTGLFTSQNSIFGSNDRLVGEIAGKGIKYETFDVKVKNAIEDQKRQSGKTTLTEAETDQIVQQVWSQTINEEVIFKEYDKLGIAVSDAELYDIMVDHPNSTMMRVLSDQQTGKVNPQFADPVTGQVSPAKIKQHVQSMNDEDETRWANLEDYVRQLRMYEKYSDLIKKGMYVTKSQAKRDFIAQNTTMNLKYVIKNYKMVADSTIKPTESELSDYYNAHLPEFKQDASRKVEYVAFDISPSQEDFDSAKADMQKIVNDYKTQKLSDDSTFVVASSDSRYYDKSFHEKGTLSPNIDSLMFKMQPGEVYGPYMENGTYLAAKVEAVKTSADSAKIRHILIAYKGSGASQTVTRSKEQAKKLADSLLAVVKKGGKFVDLVAKYSDDGGKNMGIVGKGKDGDYGWVNAKSAFVPEFKDAGLDNKKGDIVIAESQFGYHIIEVMDSKGAEKKIQVSTIDKRVDPSAKTMQTVFTQASQFAGQNTSNEAFQKAVVDQKLNKRIADNITEDAHSVSGLENPKVLVRWAFDNKKGTVSEPMDFGSKYIVAVLTDVHEKGTASMDEVKDALTAKVIKEKKAAMFSKEFTDAMAGGASIDAIGSKMKLAVEQAPNLNFGSAALPGSTNEPAVIGAASVQKAQTLSKPLMGREGVFVVYVESVTPAPAQKDYIAQQKAAITQAQARVDIEVSDALKETANITQHLVKYY